MEDRFENEPEQNTQSSSQYVYTDPNEGVKPEPEEQRYGFQYNYGQDNQYQSNYDYNTSNSRNYTQNYDQGMDTSPMSMGDWLLTILVSMIPCAGIVLYFVWAFGKTGNINRRNFCRANLIIMAGVFVLYLILVLVFGIAFISGGNM